MSYTMEDTLAWAALRAARAQWGPEEPVNIFYLDHEVDAAAQAHTDRHVVHMTLTAAQLLSTAWHEAGADEVVSDLFFSDLPGQSPPWECPTYPQLRLRGSGRLYQPHHPQHPCARWARANRANYAWLHALGVALCHEHQYRFKRPHPCAPVFLTLKRPPPALPKAACHDEPPLAMPRGLRVVDADGCWDAVPSYRRYYVETQHPLFKWTKRAAPDWLRCMDGVWSLAS